MATIELKGIKELQITLSDLREFGETTLSAAVVRAGLQAVAKQMRSDIDSRVQSVRQEVGYRFVRQATKGVRVGKVGVGVGKRWAHNTERRGRAGIGINSGNWHWWVLGTFKGERFARRKRGGGRIAGVKPQSRGTMPAQQPNFASNAAIKAKPAVMAAMQRVGRKAINSFSSRHK